MPEGTSLRIAMVAGEASGDLLGSRVLRALRRHLPELTIEAEGIGGSHMDAEGFHSLYPLERLAVMGFVEPLGRLPELLRIRRELAQRWRENPPDLFLGIDAPDFNLGLARRLRDGGLRTAQLVSPTVWAWRPKRIHKVARAVDCLLCLFPFEPALYADVRVDARFVGHPLVKELAEVPTRSEVRAALGIDDHATVIALLPGSRGGEVAQHGPSLLAAGQLLCSRDRSRQLLVPAASEDRRQQIVQMLASEDRGHGVRLLDGQSREAMLAADVVVLASGTASLEAMLLRRPMVIAYRTAPLSWNIISRLAVTPYAGLPNILAGRRIVPELLQDDMNATALALEAETLLADGGEQVAALGTCRHALDTDFDAGVVHALKDLMEKPGHA